jgi:hypothetical protein
VIRIRDVDKCDASVWPPRGRYAVVIAAIRAEQRLRHHERLLTASALEVIPLAAMAAMTFASPAKDVQPAPIARSTFEAFNVRSDPHGPVDFRAHASRPMDVFVRQHDYKPGGFTGWHTHPGPVFLQV